MITPCRDVVRVSNFVSGESVSITSESDVANHRRRKMMNMHAASTSSLQSLPGSIGLGFGQKAVNDGQLGVRCKADQGEKLLKAEEELYEKVCQS